MKTITLREIPTELAERIEEESSRSGKSLNKTVIQMLSSKEELTKEGKKTYHDLDHLFGLSMSEEVEQLNEVIQDLRTVDAEMWK